VADDLLSIGQFARLAGLSVGALRHYDELDLLRPADVDPFTGYRRYRSEQLETARVIGRLRELEMPLDEIREVLAIVTARSASAASTATAPGSRPGPTASSASSTTSPESRKEIPS
jgi:DNA-binding transcriptional MerR regulator